jgi:hypothetical protein
MQPNDQQGLNQPGQNQPGPEVIPQPSIAPQSPNGNPALAPLGGSTPRIDPNELQAALDEPTPDDAATPEPVTDDEPVEVPTDDQNDDNDNENDDESFEPVTWVAHEYIHQEKGTLWFSLFAIVVVVLIATSIFLMHSWSFAILMVVITVVVIVYSRRPPRELTYTLDNEGLTIDGKLDKFSSFKSFGVLHDGEHFSVMLIPTQRFQPSVTVYFPEEAGEDIVDVLGSRLPMKDLKLDAVDRVVRLLRL